MALEGELDIPALIEMLGKVGLWLQAIGIIVVLWIIFQSIALYFNRKRMKEIYAIKNDMKRIEDKINRILRRAEKRRL